MFGDSTSDIFHATITNFYSVMVEEGCGVDSYVGSVCQLV